MRACIGVMAAAAALGLTGCGTMINLGAQKCPIYEHPRIFGGVRIDAVHVLPELVPLGFLCALLDFPFSLAFDILTLPWTIPSTLEYGDRDTWPEPSGPTAIVEGVVVRTETPGYHVAPADEIWRTLPAGLQPLPSVRVRVFAKGNGAELAMGEPPISDNRGHFSLFSGWDSPWDKVRFECDGFEPLEIPASALHSPIDHNYWSEHRLFIRLKRR
jgi:hypothetical protein